MLPILTSYKKYKPNVLETNRWMEDGVEEKAMRKN